MSDEKRQTRLLPFRRRRAGATRYDAPDFAEHDGAEGLSDDAELTALLRAWEAPAQASDARARLLADFRASAPTRPLWRRALAAELRVPAPVAACLALAFVASLFAVFTFGARGLTRTAAPAEAKTEAAPEVKVVEVPVVQERVVTRTVYVEKKERGAARVSSPPQVPTREAARETLAQGAAREEAGGQTPGRDSNAGYFTRVNMEDFQPANEVNFRIVKRVSADER